MDKALSPYVKGGGAKKYEEELKKVYGMDGSAGGSVGGFQQMTQDALTVLNDIPFSIPPYFALIARAVVTLEGVALIGDPNYGMIMAAYRESPDSFTHTCECLDFDRLRTKDVLYTDLNEKRTAGIVFAALNGACMLSTSCV